MQNCQNCSKTIENYCFKHKNFVGFRRLCPLTPHRGALPLDPCTRARQYRLLGLSTRPTVTFPASDVTALVAGTSNYTAW